MRIRKNARLITPPSSSSSSSSPSLFLVCQLNRSPWDVDDYNSFSLQDNYEFGFNGILHPFSDNSMLSGGESMELSYEYVEKTQPPPSQPPPLQPPSINNCQSPSPSSFPPLPPIPKKRGRPKKPISTISTSSTGNNYNPYEFYYYSGFGPRWGGNSKRRGGCLGGVKRYDNGESPGSSSSTTTMTMNHIAKIEDDDDENDNGVLMVDEEEVDYIEDDFYDDEEEEFRKPVKARSLKSLM